MTTLSFVGLSVNVCVEFLRIAPGRLCKLQFLFTARIGYHRSRQVFKLAVWVLNAYATSFMRSSLFVLP